MTQMTWSPVHSGTPQKQLLSIQYLRGLAAISVLVTHALQWPLADMNMALLKTGRLGVDVFFVISGFIITIIAGDGYFNPREFLSRRSSRIVPTYWAATLLVTTLAIAMPSQFRTTIPTVEGLLKSLLFIPSVEPKAPLLLLGWSLNFEVFFYVLFGSLFFAKSEVRTSLLLGLLAVLITIGQFATHLNYVQTFYTSPSLVGFAFGTVLAQAYRHGLLARFSVPLRRAAVPVMLGLLIAFYTDDWSGTEEIALWKHLLMSSTALAIVLFPLTYETAGGMSEIAVLKYIGNTSYSIYLFHMFSVAAVWAFAKRMFDLHHTLPYLACASLAITAGLATGLIFHYLVEKPFLSGNFSFRRTTRRTAV